MALDLKSREFFSSESPSVSDGMSEEEETQCRLRGLKFMKDLCGKLELPFPTFATASVFFQRFYLTKSHHDFDVYVVGTACVLVAGKTEETPKKVKSIVKCLDMILNEDHMLAFGESELDTILLMEERVLKAVQFDFVVNHPYKILCSYAKSFLLDKKTVERLLSIAYGFINDSYFTRAAVMFDPEFVAIAAMHLATMVTEIHIHYWSGQTSEHLFWWDAFVKDMGMSFLKGICQELLDSYQDQFQIERHAILKVDLLKQAEEIPQVAMDIKKKMRQTEEAQSQLKVVCEKAEDVCELDTAIEAVINAKMAVESKCLTDPLKVLSSVSKKSSGSKVSSLASSAEKVKSSTEKVKSTKQATLQETPKVSECEESSNFTKLRQPAAPVLKDPRLLAQDAAGDQKVKEGRSSTSGQDKPRSPANRKKKDKSGKSRATRQSQPSGEILGAAKANVTTAAETEPLANREEVGTVTVPQLPEEYLKSLKSYHQQQYGIMAGDSGLGSFAEKSETGGTVDLKHVPPPGFVLPSGIVPTPGFVSTSGFVLPNGYVAHPGFVGGGFPGGGLAGVELAGATGPVVPTGIILPPGYVVGQTSYVKQDGGYMGTEGTGFVAEGASYMDTEGVGASGDLQPPVPPAEPAIEDHNGKGYYQQPYSLYHHPTEGEEVGNASQTTGSPFGESLPQFGVTAPVHLKYYQPEGVDNSEMVEQGSEKFYPFAQGGVPGYMDSPTDMENIVKKTTSNREAVAKILAKYNKASNTGGGEELATVAVGRNETGSLNQIGGDNWTRGDNLATGDNWTEGDNWTRAHGGSMSHTMMQEGEEGFTMHRPIGGHGDGPSSTMTQGKRGIYDNQTGNEEFHEPQGMPSRFFKGNPRAPFANTPRHAVGMGPQSSFMGGPRSPFLGGLRSPFSSGFGGNGGGFGSDRGGQPFMPEFHANGPYEPERGPDAMMYRHDEEFYDDRPLGGALVNDVQLNRASRRLSGLTNQFKSSEERKMKPKQYGRRKFR